jgi:hypothetical protein
MRPAGQDLRHWNKVPDDLGKSGPMVRNAVRHWVAGKFMAATYDVWALPTKQASLFTPGCDWRYDLKGCRRDVAPADVPAIECIINPRTLNAKYWKPFSGVSPDAAYYMRDQLGLTVWDEGVHPRHGSNMLLLAQSPNIFDDKATTHYPPQSLLTQLYTPPDQGGYGWERPWLYNMGQGFLWHTFGSSLPDDSSLQCEW